MRILVRRSNLWAIPAAMLVLVMGSPMVVAEPRPPATSVVPQLWAPDQPVDILVYNPHQAPLPLPEPYTPPTIPDLYGPGVTEEDLTSPTRDWGSLAPRTVRVGPNVSFAITYADDANEGFNDATLGNDRMTAFEYAVNRWAARLQGPASISIQATMTPLSGTVTQTVLASCGPGQFHENFGNAPTGNTYYPEALVEIISGSDPDSNTFDINVDYNSDVDGVVLGGVDWYYGTDGTPGTDIDFVTVTIHELCHGLGFVDSFQADGTYGLGDAGHPVIFDRFLVGANGAPLFLIAPSPSNVIGNNVFWQGLRGRFAFNEGFGGVGNVPMYAPTPFEDGSSIAHLDEATFTGDWELQTPFNSGPVHSPDPIVMGILQDIGHSLPQSRYVDHNASGFQDGSSANPYDTVTEAVMAVPSDGFVRILPGTYAESMTIIRAMELHSSGGTAVIGPAAAASSQEP